MPMEKNNLSTIVVRMVGYPQAKFLKSQFGFYLTPYTKIKSEWIIDLYARTETMKLLEKNIQKKIFMTSG